LISNCLFHCGTSDALRDKQNLLEVNVYGEKEGQRIEANSHRYRSS